MEEKLYKENFVLEKSWGEDGLFNEQFVYVYSCLIKHGAIATFNPLKLCMLYKNINITYEIA